MIKAKVVLMGDSGVGKTSIITRITKDTFSAEVDPTTVCNVQNHVVNTEKGKMEFALWDTSGDDEYNDLINLYLKKTNIYLLVFDITNKKSFENIDKWNNYIKNEAEERNTSTNDNKKKIITFLIGNKYDAIEENPNAREVTYSMATKKAQALGCYQYEETSAKKSLNLSEIFQMLAIEDTFNAAMAETSKKLSTTSSSNTIIKQDNVITEEKKSSNQNASSSSSSCADNKAESKHQAKGEQAAKKKKARKSTEKDQEDEEEDVEEVNCQCNIF